MTDVDKYVLRSKILDRFRSAKYSSPELVDHVKGRSLSTSTLARIYESKDFIDLAGLKLDAAGRLSCKLNKKVFDAVAEVIVQGMVDGDINTRSVNTVTSPRFTELMEQLRDIVEGDGKASRPADKAKTSTGSKEQEQASGGGGANSSAGGTGQGSTGQPGPRPGSRQKARAFLDVAQFNAPSTYPASIERILREFSTLNIDKYPNAAFDLLRTLLEKTAKSFAEANGVDLKPKGQGGYVYLSNCLDWLETWFKANGPKSQVQVVKKVRSNMSRDFHGSQDLMNAINHNHHIFATGDDVRIAWDTMRSLLAEMLK